MVFLRSLRAVRAGLVEQRNFAETQRRCDQIIADLHVSAPFDIAKLIDRTGETLGRPVIPLPMAMPFDGPTGILMQTATEHYILFRNNTSRVHQESIILHELAHILCGHIDSREMGKSQSRALFPGLDPDMVISMLSRTAYSDVQEREAELVGSLLRTKLGMWSTHSNWSMPDDIAPVIARIERVLCARVKDDR